MPFASVTIERIKAKIIVETIGFGVGLRAIAVVGFSGIVPQLFQGKNPQDHFSIAFTATSIAFANSKTTSNLVSAFVIIMADLNRKKLWLASSLPSVSHQF